MKIGVINFHFAYNYGAVLECVALNAFLKKEGYETEIINYRPAYGMAQFAVYPPVLEYAKRAYRDFSDRSVSYRMYRVFRRSVQALIRYRDIGKNRRRKAVFEAFQLRHLKQSALYRSIGELRESPPRCDVYISGSDQIWNPYVTNAGLDPAYFLDFGDSEIRRIAYAVSPCQLETEKYETELIRLLRKYNAISLREEQHQNALTNLYGKQIETCIDPTLLLDKQAYALYEEKPAYVPQDYILLYGFRDRDNPKILNDTLSLIQRQTQLQVIDISQERIRVFHHDTYLDAISPGEFLYYIKNARYVVTNSFHGTAFSVIYRKNFWSIEMKATASRMRELMLKAGLHDRLISEYNEQKLCNSLHTEMDYTKAAAYLQREKEHATGFIRSAIEGIELKNFADK